MSRKGNCWDNAVAKSFFKSLKVEAIYQYHFENKKQAKIAVFEYIETWYNKNRRHSHLNNLTIKEFEFINQLKSMPTSLIKSLQSKVVTPSSCCSKMN